MLLLRSIDTLSMQLSGGVTNIFQQNSLRYLGTLLLATGVSVVRKVSVKVERKYIFQIVFSSFFGVCTSCLLFFSASFMPVGNTEALCVGLSVLFPTIIDFSKGQIMLKSAISSLFTISGLIFLAQPWHQIEEHKKIQMIPCEYWQDYLHWNQSVKNTLFNDSSQTFNSGNKSDHFIFIDGLRYPVLINPIYVGYILIFFAAIVGIIRGYAIKDLRNDITSGTLAFWLGLLEMIICFILTIIWSVANGIELYTFPTGSICLTLVILFSLCGGLVHCLWIYTLGNFSISKLSLADCVILLLMFICQRTFLKSFHPGAVNWYETLGVVIIIVSLLLVCFFELISILQNKND